jgi:hypothetical protein
MSWEIFEYHDGLLHLAAANSRTNVLLHAARTDRANNHRLIPQMPTRKTRKEWSADVLKEWLVNKNRDLREREGWSGSRRKR